MSDLARLLQTIVDQIGIDALIEALPDKIVQNALKAKTFADITGYLLGERSDGGAKEE